VSQFHFVFPPDLRFFVQTAIPVSPYFVNWRADSDELTSWFSRLINGILFDVQNDIFWYSDWGPRPISTSDAVQFAKEQITAAPLLVPIGDRIFTKYLPAVPNTAGNPVFSICQTDALHAGRDLADFLQWFSRPNESFESDEEEDRPPTPLYCEDYLQISFWTDLVRLNVKP
jgi:hypothetical protein